MQILVIAEEGEREMAKRLFPDTDIIVTGVGAINIIRSLSNIPRDTQIINVGYAGSANYDIGTWVRVSEVRLHHPNVTYPEPALPLTGNAVPHIATEYVEAPCYSNVDFVLSSPFKDCVFDMELAFIAAMGFEKVTSYKYVSDNLSLHQYHQSSNGVE